MSLVSTLPRPSRLFIVRATTETRCFLSKKSFHAQIFLVAGISPPIALSDRPREDAHTEQPDVDDTNHIEPNPDGGYGWVVIVVCFIHTFWQNAWTGSWGILQVALLKTTLRGSSSSTVSFIGALGIALSCALGIFTIGFARIIGARWTSLIGILLYSLSNIVSAWAVSNVGALFIACGFMYGLGE